MDALKHVLHAIRLKPQLFRRYELTAPWRLQLTASNVAAFHLVEKGACWIQIMSLDQTIGLATGDLVVVSNTAQYQLVDKPESLMDSARGLGGTREPITLNARTSRSEGMTTLTSGEFRSEHNIVYPLFSLLPTLIHIKNHEGQPIYWLATALRGIASEAQGLRPGHEAVISRLMDILFIMVMRSWIDQHGPEEGGWLGALYDPQIGKVLNAVHGAPERPWTLEALAQIAAMSRSAFVERFAALVGEPPMKYVTRWRIQLATTWLADDNLLTVEQIAHLVGYATPFAFSKAFKRLLGMSPTEYREKQ